MHFIGKNDWRGQDKWRFFVEVTLAAGNETTKARKAEMEVTEGEKAGRRKMTRNKGREKEK